uniref:ORF110 n=2 Tax=Leptospirillum ferrooxidans TaxID=180 RepID=Q58KB8_9BACT|nr:ORF110 [Leptospirillum ferrooxidans]
MPGLDDRIKDLEDKLKKAKAQKQQIERAEKTRLSKKQRAEETRKKILLGSYYMTKMADEELKKKIISGLDKFLTRNDDRALFGLPELPPPPPPSHLTDQQGSRVPGVTPS